VTEINPEVTFTLDDAVEEVFGILFGQDLTYDPTFDRYRVVARMINRALRANALEHEWSYYHDELALTGVPGDRSVALSVDSTVRVRQTGDDAVRLADLDGEPLAWAYFLPRDALHKVRHQPGWWVSVVRNTLQFSAPLPTTDFPYNIIVPIMREPYRFVIPAPVEDPNDPLPAFDPAERAKAVDFHYPDVICARAAYMYSKTDPVIQPRAQTLEADYKDLMYQAIERDDRYTDSPLENNFVVPVQNGIYPESSFSLTPMADRRR
jgi:hypothetical protein